MCEIAKNVVSTVANNIRNHRGSAILVRVAEQNIPHVREGVTRYVAQIESWGETDVTSYNTFELAKQTLYLSYNILIEVHQKEMSHPDHSYTSVDVSGYNEFIYDLELNYTDPYFNVIQRDYYNEVSS